jgi:hypothetical protein
VQKLILTFAFCILTFAFPFCALSAFLFEFCRGIREEEPMSAPYDQWRDDCPKCHNRDCLIVFEVKQATTGRAYHPESALRPDGFYFAPDNPDDDASTYDEKVRCDLCGAVFGLCELELPE